MTFNWIELGIFAGVIVIVTILLVNNIRLFIQNKSMTNELVQVTVDKMALENSLDKLVGEYELLSMQETDGFIKFLSESRDWAFEYIEDVQGAIGRLVLAMNSADEDAIAAAYAELIKHLPKAEPND